MGQMNTDMEEDTAGLAPEVQGASILLVDDDQAVRKLFAQVLESDGYFVDGVSSGEDAVQLMQDNEYHLVIIDKNLPGISGMDVIIRARALQPSAEILLITGYGSYESVIAALRLGVFDYLEKPFSDIAMVSEKVRRALQKQRLYYENKVLADQLRKVNCDMKEIRRKLEETLTSGQMADEEKVTLYLNEMVNMVTLDAQERLIEMEKAMLQVSRYLLALQAKIDEVAQRFENPQAPVEDIRKLIRKARSAISASRDIAR